MEKIPVTLSPVGTAIYPWITKPDTKFNPGGDYRVKLRMPSEAAQKLVDQIKATQAKAVAESKAKKKKPPKEAPLPFAVAYDDEGNETDEVEFNFKAKATITTKDGKTLTKKIKVVDSQNKLLPEDVSVWGGSKIRVAFQMIPFDTAIGVGVSLRMGAVQVIELVEGGGSSPFDVVEDGYVADTGKASGDTEEDSTSDDPSDF